MSTPLEETRPQFASFRAYDAYKEFFKFMMEDYIEAGKLPTATYRPKFLKLIILNRFHEVSHAGPSLVTEFTAGYFL